MATELTPLTLVTGATGYIGGRLLRALHGREHRVRCLARRPEALRTHAPEGVEVVRGDVLDRDSLGPALEGVTTAHYLIHSMGTGKDFAEKDRRAAENFGAAAREAGVERIVYLGGLGEGPDLSLHLASRHEVGEVLRASGVPAVEFRASIIIGSGSLSFDLLRALVRKLPVMVTPKWLSSRAQPIAVEDVIDYLVEATERPPEGSPVCQIGGPDVVTYKDLLRLYAEARGLKRAFIPVPVLTPRLSSHWLGLVTPVHARVGRKLVESLINDTVVTDPESASHFRVEPRGAREAIDRALAKEDMEYALTRWSDAASSGRQAKDLEDNTYRSRVKDSRCREVDCAPEAAFAPIVRIGGRRGWYYGNILWRIRGAMDLAVGGVGLRRGRRDPVNLRPGDALDFWRVEAVEPHRLLRLRAEMKLPGRAWLQFEVEPLEGGRRSQITQTALFDPHGLFGLLYWYALWPIHWFVFEGMLRNIARAADRGNQDHAAGDIPPAG